MGRIENRRTCVVCGKKYKACRNCEESVQRGTFTWRASCDTKECFSVMLILNDYFYKRYTKDEAKALLEDRLDETMLPYNENTRFLVEEIMKNDDIILNDISDMENPDMSIASVPEDDASDESLANQDTFQNYVDDSSVEDVVETDVESGLVVSPVNQECSVDLPIIEYNNDEYLF